MVKKTPSTNSADLFGSEAGRGMQIDPYPLPYV